MLLVSVLPNGGFAMTTSKVLFAPARETAFCPSLFMTLANPWSLRMLSLISSISFTMAFDSSALVRSMPVPAVGSYTLTPPLTPAAACIIQAIWTGVEYACLSAL